MQSDRPPTPSHGFLVERYLPASAVAGLTASVAGVAKLCGDRSEVGNSIRYLQSVYLPTEDTCFCLFSAASMRVVRAVNDDGEFAFDRITPAVLLLPQRFPPISMDRESTS